MKPCLIDSGFLYALIDEEDYHSESAKAALKNIVGEIILPIPAITEVAFFISKNLGAEALAKFLGALPEMNLTLELPFHEDYLLAGEIVRKYSDSKIDVVDALIFAIAERLNITKILTIDRRHFGMFRPAHCDAFEILP